MRFLFVDGGSRQNYTYLDQSKGIKSLDSIRFYREQPLEVLKFISFCSKNSKA